MFVMEVGDAVVAGKSVERQKSNPGSRQGGGEVKKRAKTKGRIRGAALPLEAVGGQKQDGRAVVHINTSSLLRRNDERAGGGSRRGQGNHVGETYTTYVR